MRKPTVYTSYFRWKDNALSVIAAHTVTALNENPFFPDPRPTLEVYRELVRDFCQKNEVSRNGGSRMQREAKDNAKIILAQAMREMGFYINIVSQGDREMLASSGFRLVPESRTSTIPATPLQLRIIDGRVSGEMKIVFSPVREAIEYEYQLATKMHAQEELIWREIFKTSRSRQNFVADLIPGERYFVRVRARNKQGESDWTDPASLIVR